MARTKQRARKTTSAGLKGKKVALASSAPRKQHGVLQPVIKEEKEEQRVGVAGPRRKPVVAAKQPVAGAKKTIVKPEAKTQKATPGKTTRLGLDRATIKRKAKRGTKALR